MSQEHDGSEGASSADVRAAYETPVFVLVGNLNDLLAGNASQNPDFGTCTGAAGEDPTPC